MTKIFSFLIDLFQSFLGNSNKNKLVVNLENAQKRLKTINDVHYPQFRRDGSHYLSRDGALWFVRKDLESARYYYTGGREGYAVSDRVQDTLKLYLVDPRFKMLKEELDTTEAKVKEMEKVKGYEFDRIEANNIIYKELKTGKMLSSHESNHV